MDFLKEVLGDELFTKVKSAINAHNGDEANKESQIKLANLAGGEYVGKGKYDGLQEQLNGKIAELQTANDLIADMKKSTPDSEELQSKITAYETQVGQLQTALAETKIKSAIKVALLTEKAVDVDYLTYKLESKLKEDGKTIKLNDNEEIEGWNDLLSGLKTQFPTQFESGTNGKKVMEHKLEEGEEKDAITKESILKMSYQDRAKLYEKNPEGYKTAMNT